MPKPTNSRKDKRNALIKEDYVHLYFTEGKREEVIWADLADKYFLEPDTIRKLILKLCKN